MILFPKDLEIAEDEGFTKEKDIFNRRVLGEDMTTVITSVDQPLVLALDAPWGTGKTVFLKMWAGELRKQKIPVIYFDAFENDYLDDAFIAIAGEIIALAKEEGKAKAKAFIEKTKAAASVITRAALKIGVKAATLGAIDTTDINSIENLGKDIADEASNTFDKHLGERLTNTRKEKETIQQFRDALENLPASFPENKSQKLVIIIDELDRCRPHFALEVLERMKHFFSVPNVYFVLGVNTEQLANQVKANHGAGIDAHTYLQKFIHYSFNFYESDPNSHLTFKERYVVALITELQISEKITRDIVLDEFKRILSGNDISFRTIERIMSHVMIASQAKEKKKQFCDLHLVVGLSTLKLVSPKIYEKAKNRGLKFTDIEKILSLDISKKSKNIEWDINFWKFHTGEDIGEQGIEWFNKLNFQYRFASPDEIIPYICNEFIERIG